MTRQRFDIMTDWLTQYLSDVEPWLAVVCAAWAATDNGIPPDRLVPLAERGRAIVWC